MRRRHRANLSQLAGVILAASVHVGRHEPAMVQFVRDHRAELEKLPTALLSVSLTEAGAEDHDRSLEERMKAREDVEQMLQTFYAESNFQPRRVQPVAGALLYTQYGRLLRLAMKFIAKRAGGSTDTSRDHVYTDWQALERFAEEFAEELTAGAS